MFTLQELRSSDISPPAGGLNRKLVRSDDVITYPATSPPSSISNPDMPPVPGGPCTFRVIKRFSTAIFVVFTYVRVPATFTLSPGAPRLMVVGPLLPLLPTKIVPLEDPDVTKVVTSCPPTCMLPPSLAAPATLTSDAKVAVFATLSSPVTATLLAVSASATHTLLPKVALHDTVSDEAR